MDVTVDAFWNHTLRELNQIADAYNWRLRVELHRDRTMSWLNAYLTRVKHFPSLDSISKAPESEKKKAPVTNETIAAERAFAEKMKQLYQQKMKEKEAVQNG